jgi:hypothetical protein
MENDFASSCEHGNEPLRSIKEGECLDCFSRWTLLHGVTEEEFYCVAHDKVLLVSVVMLVILRIFLSFLARTECFPD